jgi:hypothetical protein
MADRDIYSYTPKRENNRITGPTVTELRAALSAANVEESGPNEDRFPDSKLQTMTKNDMLNAVRVHDVAVSHVVVS